MSPLRWLSVCCFVVCGWCAGDSFHQQAQAHLEALRKTLDLLETLHQEISFRRSDAGALSLPDLRRTHPLLRMFFRPGAVGSGAGVQTA